MAKACDGSVKALEGPGYFVRATVAADGADDGLVFVRRGGAHAHFDPSLLSKEACALHVCWSGATALANNDG